MNFFETSDKKVIFDIDKIKMIIKLRPIIGTASKKPLLAYSALLKPSGKIP